MHRTACARVDLGALQHNFEQARRFAGSSKVMCVIKANAYGHGLLQIADSLQQADGFAVACVAEAVALRQHGIQQPITVFQGFANDQDLSACAEHDLWPVVHEEQQLKRLAQTRAEIPSTLWLKLSSGMNRLGFVAEEAAQLWQKLNAISGVEQVRLMTHMARADEGVTGQSDFTAEQTQRFFANTKAIDTECSLANSAVLLSRPEACAEWVRPGIMLYGGSPFLTDVKTAEAFELKPVMHLTSRLIAINVRKQGDSIGYGSVWQCPEDMPVGVVAIGYGDGYPRHIDDSAYVSINGQRAPVVGRVSMDLLTLDLRGVQTQVGDEVVLWGAGVPADDIATAASTISYELFCGVYGRVHYQYS